jgi:acetylornithine/succinyldiaminopimelate/putrescine aminotransferase
VLNRLPELPVYPIHPIALARGAGAYVYDEAGVEYLDMYGGHAVAVTGHCHPRVTQAIAAQAAQLIFYSNIVESPVRRGLCEKLMHLTGGHFAAAFLINSGAEANEAALTLSRLHTGRKRIASVSGGFHGRSLLTLSLSGLPRYRKLADAGGEPLFPHATLLPFGDIEIARRTIDESFAAIIIEPVQGLAGCVPASTKYLAALREICDRVGAALVFDEVQCGMGRSGAFLACEASGVWPDVATLAKGLGGGFPIAAALIHERLLAAAKPGDLGTTFGGGPLACAAALANLQALEDEAMMANARVVGAHLAAGMAALPQVLRVQGAGLLLGAVLDRPAAAVADQLLREHRVLVGTSAAPDVLRVMPPLNLTAEQADRFVAALGDTLQKGN